MAYRFSEVEEAVAFGTEDLLSQGSFLSANCVEMEYKTDTSKGVSGCHEEDLSLARLDGCLRHTDDSIPARIQGL